MPKTKAIFFDLDETLIENKLSVTDVFKHVYSDFDHELGEHNSHAFFAELSVRAKHIWSTMFDVERSPEQQLIECFEHSIVATNAIDSTRQLSLAQDMLSHFVALSANNVCCQDHAENVLSDLRSMGYITGIITNGVEQVQLGKIHHLELHKQVDHIIVSAQAKAHKPLRPAFNLALQRAQVGADVSMMIGDHPTNDVAGSIRAGLTGVYYNPKHHKIDHAFAKLKERPDHTINRLSTVLSLLW